MPKTNPFVKNAFIIRPFGKKPVSLPGSDGKKASTVELDFDRVETQLIDPALTALGIRGRTTIEIMRAGNIREDMFHRLLTADLVIADLSIHNANVFYELGLRHAFRDKHTFLLRCEGFSQYPFDLQTDRYYTYKLRNPAASLPGLVTALGETISSDREDSPVYKLLPNLKVQDRARFLAAPREFSEAIERAKKAERPGDLRLLAVEAEGFIWEVEGLREVGRAQYEMNFHWGARATWETLRHHYPDDHEANLMLTRIYQRLYEHSEESEMQAKSGQALERIYNQPGLERTRQSEVLSLIGRQRKAEWIHSWEHLPDEQQRREQALNSLSHQEAYEAYTAAFYENLNNYNAGLNALALLLVQNELAHAHRDVWDSLYEAPKEELDRLATQVTKLKSGVALSLEAEKARVARDRSGKRNYWLELNEASFYCITSTQRVRVRQEFDEALRLASPARIESLREVLDTYRLLGVFTENVQIAFKSLSAVLDRGRLNVPKPCKQKKRILLFAGHRLDPLTPTEALRQQAKRHPRFPRDKEYEEKARQAIEAAVKKEQQQSEILFGMSGGANGGELIFHEVCHALQFSTKLYLAVPREEFIGQFVSLSAEPDEWYERFNHIYYSEQTIERVQLGDTAELPRWLQLKPHYDIRRRSGLWTLQNALVNRVLNDADVTLIALWDGNEDDATGTIDDLIKRAYDKGIKVVLLETREIFGR